MKAYVEILRKACTVTLTNKHLLNTYYVLGAVVGDEDFKEQS